MRVVSNIEGRARTMRQRHGRREFGAMVRYIQGSPDSRMPRGLTKVSYLSGVDGKLVEARRSTKSERKKSDEASEAGAGSTPTNYASGREQPA
jgi:hypothetical protein